MKENLNQYYILQRTIKKYLNDQEVAKILELLKLKMVLLY